MSLLSTFGIEADKYKVETDDLEAFAKKSNTTTLILNQKVRIPASFNGKSLTAWATLRNAEWHRITGRDHEVVRAGEDPRMSQTIGFSFKNVVIDIDLQMPDGTVMPLQDFARAVAGSLINGAPTQEEIDKVVKDCGLNFDGMPMFLQQMGASENGFAHAVEFFKTNGGVDDMKSVANNPMFHTAYALPKGTAGLKVLQFEMTPQDRSQSANKKGFIDLVDAVMSNFLRMWEHKKELRGLNIRKEQAGLSQADIKKIEGEISEIEKMIGNYGSSWSGSARQRDKITKVEMNKYNALNIGCGRWIVEHNGNVVDFDAWKDSAKVPTVAVEQILNAPVVDTNQKPF
jgi:hypothetical protein